MDRLPSILLFLLAGGLGPQTLTGSPEVAGSPRLYEPGEPTPDHAP